VKKGDLISQTRRPGGFCTLVEIFKSEESYDESDHGWTEYCWPIFRVVHPVEGLIDDPSYYYCTLEEQEAFERRHLKYLLQKEGAAVPDWLEEEIENDANR